MKKPAQRPSFVVILEHASVCEQLYGAVWVLTADGFQNIKQVVPHNRCLTPVIPIDVGDGSSKEITSSKCRVFGLIRLSVLQRETFGVNLARMLTDRLTFSEALYSESYGLMDKQRLKVALLMRGGKIFVVMM